MTAPDDVVEERERRAGVVGHDAAHVVGRGDDRAEGLDARDVQRAPKRFIVV